jgi:hypothetical protein
MSRGVFMFNSVQYVRQLCEERNLPVSRLEKDCGFSNGYLNPKKMSKIPYDRAVIISNYLEIPVEDIYGEEKAPTPKRERDGSEILFALSRGGEVEITDEMYEEVKRFAEYIAQREK